MQAVVWFMGTLVLAVLYGMRMHTVIGYVPDRLWRWYTAVPVAGGIALGALVVAQTDLAIDRTLAVGLHCVVLCGCSWLGLRYWVKACWWSFGSCATAVLLVASYLFWRSPLNNLVLALVSLGISVAGYYAGKAWVRVLFIGLALFDAYAVWFSDTMAVVLEKHPGAFPTQFLAMIQLPFLEIGTLDVIMATMAVVSVQRHRGIKRSVWLVFWCMVCVFSNEALTSTGISWLQGMPYLVCLAPIVLVGLSDRPR